jgi:hypothetical protein
MYCACARIRFAYALESPLKETKLPKALESALLSHNIRRLVLYEPPIPTGVPMYPENLPDKMQLLIARDSLEAALELFMREVVRMPESELKIYRQLINWAVSPAWDYSVSIQ